jgi:hypothetical protein
LKKSPKGGEKMKYEKPELEIVVLERINILTVSEGNEVPSIGGV